MNEEAEARAKQAAAELLAELGLEDSPKSSKICRRNLLKLQGQVQEKQRRQEEEEKASSHQDQCWPVFN